jgi:hypothetical protein
MTPQDTIAPPTSAPPPETDAVITAALAALEREIQTARATSDPLVHPLKALAATVLALHHLFVNGTRTLRQAQQMTPVLTPAAERQLLDRLAEEARKTVRGATWEAHRQMNWQLAGTVGAAVAVLMLVSGFGGYWAGWWQRGRAQAAAASLEMCRDGATIVSTDGTRKGCVVWLGPAMPQPPLPTAPAPPG